MKWLAFAVAVIVLGIVYLHRKQAQTPAAIQAAAADPLTPDMSDPIAWLYGTGNAYWLPDSPMAIMPQSSEGYASGASGSGSTFPFNFTTAVNG